MPISGTRFASFMVQLKTNPRLKDHKRTVTNKLETFICYNKVYRVAVLHLFLPRCGFIHLPKVIQKKQLLVETMAYVYNTNLQNISKSVFTTFFFVATNSLYWCAIVQTMSLVRQSRRTISTFLRPNIPTFVHCIRCAFASSPSVQSPDSAGWRRSGVSGR